MKAWILAILLPGLFLGQFSLFAQPTLVSLLNNGPTDKRINIVFLAEGYTSADLPQFTNDSRRVLDAILKTPPFADYQRHFNGFAIPVVSAESGSDHPSRNVYRDTYFNSTFDSFDTERLITIPPNDRDSTYAHGKGKIDALLESLMPEFDISVLIVNDSEYGGSGGVPLVTSVNTYSAEIAVHELGHSFGGLGDEYEGSFTGGDAEQPNTTQETIRDRIKWRSWILDSTPVPTPETSAYGAVVGLFEGANYRSTGWYRPKLNCKMRTLGVPFCEVCGQTLVRSVYRILPPIDQVSPTQTNLTAFNNQPISFSVQLIASDSDSLVVEWFVDDQPIGSGTSISWDPRGAAAGNHLVKVQVHDPTTRVRIDAESLLTETRFWNVLLAAPPRLRITRASGAVNVCWDTHVTDFVLESRALGGTLWAEVPGTPNAANNDQCLAIPMANNSNQFFRLRQKP